MSRKIRKARKAKLPSKQNMQPGTPVLWRYKGQQLPGWIIRILAPSPAGPRAYIRLGVLGFYDRHGNTWRMPGARSGDMDVLVVPCYQLVFGPRAVARHIEVKMIWPSNWLSHSNSLKGP